MKRSRPSRPRLDRVDRVYLHLTNDWLADECRRAADFIEPAMPPSSSSCKEVTR